MNATHNQNVHQHIFHEILLKIVTIEIIRLLKIICETRHHCQFN